MARPRKFSEETVLEQASRVFVQNGYTASSLALLLEATGLQKGSLYKAFGSKEALFKRCLVRYMDRKYVHLRALLENATDSYDALTSHLHQELLPDNDHKKSIKDGSPLVYKGCFIVNSMIENAPDNDDIKTILLQQSERSTHALDNIIQQAQGEGYLRLDMEAEDMAQLFKTFINGMHVYLRAGMSKQDIKDHCKLFLKTFSA